MRVKSPVEAPASDHRSLLCNYASAGNATAIQRRTFSRLNAARLESDLASRAKSELLIDISHEIRSPLNAIIGFADILAQGTTAHSDPQRIKEYAENIVEAGRQISRAVDEILDVALVDRGGESLERAPCDLASIVQEATAGINAQAAARQQVITFTNIPPIPHCSLNANVTKHIVNHFLSQAISVASSNSTIAVALNVTRDGYVCFAVTDDGPVMDEIELQRALAPLSHVPGTYGRRAERAGLALSLIKRLIELQDGRFNLISVPGEGTRAEVYFPIAEAASAIR